MCLINCRKHRSQHGTDHRPGARCTARLGCRTAVRARIDPRMSGRTVLEETMAGAGPVSEAAHELHELEHAMADPDRADEIEELRERIRLAQVDDEQTGQPQKPSAQRPGRQPPRSSGMGVQRGTERRFCVHVGAARHRHGDLQWAPSQALGRGHCNQFGKRCPSAWSTDGNRGGCRVWIIPGAAASAGCRIPGPRSAT